MKRYLIFLLLSPELLLAQSTTGAIAGSVRDASDLAALCEALLSGRGEATGTAMAREVIVDLNGNTLDGLTPGMQSMLRALLRSRRENRKGDVVFQASVNTIATAIGHGRDTKAVALFVEPYLIQEGYVVVTHGGRTLTDKGITRALELS